MPSPHARILVTAVPRHRWARAWLLCFAADGRATCDWRPKPATPRLEVPVTSSPSSDPEAFALAASIELGLPPGNHWIALRVVIAQTIGRRWVPYRQYFRYERPFAISDTGGDEIRIRAEWPPSGGSPFVPVSLNALTTQLAQFRAFGTN